jgi:hypothetical protein
VRVDGWSNELVVGQSPAGENMSKEAENMFAICHQAATGEDTSDSEDSVYALLNCRMCELAIALQLHVVKSCNCSQYYIAASCYTSLMIQVTDSTALRTTRFSKTYLKVSVHHTTCFDQHWLTSGV